MLLNDAAAINHTAASSVGCWMLWQLWDAVDALCCGIICVWCGCYYGLGWILGDAARCMVVNVVDAVG